MVWDKVITEFEQKNDWKGAIQFLEKEEKKELDVYSRVIFILLDFLVDGQYTQEEHDFIAQKIKQIFSDASLKFLNNTEFLFFSGIMIYIAEWYFGMNSLKEATTMLEKAAQREPENILYKWGYYSRIDQRTEVNTEMKRQLSEQLLKDSSTIDWLKSKGLLGEYVLGTLKGTYEAFKAL